MRIGIDFDNTIACYDGVFHRAARELGLVPADLPTSKNAVRDHLNNSGRRDEFTRLQGFVYGARMDLVACYPGVTAFIATALAAGHRIYIVSHKTRRPILGPEYDMHAAARAFLETQRIVGDGGVPASHVFFEPSKEEKVARVAALECEAFIDDLPEILAMPGFPADLRAILFDPDNRFADLGRFERHVSWNGVGAALLGDRP
jgi:hypothetical protein